MICSIFRQPNQVQFTRPT
uniref:Uncharacterized protein n=1 Tax=Anguilla anguilla TaxID=7936 RepID=A0A0E9V4I5_ANGAN